MEAENIPSKSFIRFAALQQICADVTGRSFETKITGRSPRPIKRIFRPKNEHNISPGCEQDFINVDNDIFDLALEEVMTMIKSMPPSPSAYETRRREERAIDLVALKYRDRKALDFTVAYFENLLAQTP